jgi:ribose-phosphate pyrophosphokinase
VERFPDGELRPTVTSVRGDDVYVVQPTGPPVNDNIIELMLLLDACRRAGAARLTALVPYFGYARQDRRSHQGQPVGARVMVDALQSAGGHRLVVVDPHTTALEAMCAGPVDVLTAVPVLAQALGSVFAPDTVVVAPDLGAVKLAERYASLLGLTVAVVRKTRVSGSAVVAEELVGDVDGRPALIVDDMISTGSTIEAAARVLVRRGAVSPILVAASHGLLMGDAAARLAEVGVGRLFVTDSLPVKQDSATGIEVRSIAAVLAAAVGRLHRDEDLADLVSPN